MVWAKFEIENFQRKAWPHVISLSAPIHTSVDCCFRALAMRLALLVVLVMLRLNAATAGYGGQTWQTSMNAIVLPW
jgi:hypothetical protein